MRNKDSLSVSYRDINTYHTIIGKDLDIINWTAQVFSYLPPDTSYCLITVGLQDKSARTHTHTHIQKSHFLWRCNSTQ